MASENLNLTSDIGEMAIFTRSVATKEVYITMVMRGDEMWDVQASTNAADARALHKQYVLMCKVFGPVSERIVQDKAAGKAIDRASLVRELQDDYDLAAGVKPRFFH